MRTRTRLAFSTTTLMLALAACHGPAAARAQQPEVVEDEAPDTQPVNGRFEMSIEQFDMWIYGNNFQMNRTLGLPNNGPRVRLDTMLAQKLEDLQKVCKVSDAQKEKLRLAGRGDINRFLEEVEVKRKKFEEVRRDQNKFGQFYQQIQPLRATFQAGLFADGSFFAKALKRNLDGAEAARFDADRREHSAFRYAASVDMLTARLGLALGLTDDQRGRASRVIIDNTRPPKAMGQQEFNVVFYQASTVPLAKFKDILDADQIKVLERHFAQTRFQERNLKANGYVPDDGPAPKPRGKD